VTDGKAQVLLRRDEVFAVNLINDSPHDAAVQLSLDGLSLFAFAEKAKARNYSRVIVPRKSSYLVRGWFRTLQQSDKFKLTEYSKSAAFQLSPPTGVGTITVSFAAAWDPAREKGPEDERGSAPKALGGSAIGRGKSVKTPYAEVSRRCGRTRDVVTVRYRTKDTR
jgi:hypothetical protein